LGRQASFEKEEVIGKCMKQFWDHGFEKTSITDLEKCTGLKRTSLYNSFGNKDELFRTVIDFYIDTQCTYWTGILLGAETLVEGLDRLLSTMIRDNFDKRYPTGCLITYSAAGMEHHCERTKEAINRAHGVMIDGLGTAIQRDIDAGILPATLDVRSLSLYLLNHFQGTMVLSKTIGDERSLSAVKELTLNLIRKSMQ
jgi:TetR/AcrR family transcriptional repressor of nem operon